MEGLYAGDGRKDVRSHLDTGLNRFASRLLIRGRILFLFASL